MQLYDPMLLSKGFDYITAPPTPNFYNKAVRFSGKAVPGDA